MLFVGNQVYVAIKVNGELIPLTGGQLQSLTITEACNQFLPTIEMELIDQSGLLSSDAGVRDGSIISVALARDQHEIGSSWRDFLCFPRRYRPLQVGFLVKIVGYLNFPKYLIGGSYGCFDASASDVAKSTAINCGLKAKVDSSNDKMVWIQTGQTNAKFVREVALHAWSDNNSAFITAVNRDGELLFYDISRQRSKNPKWNFQCVSDPVNVIDNENVIWVSEDDYGAEFHSDLFNITAGYGLVQRYHDFKSGVSKFEGTGGYTPHTDKLMVSKDIEGARFSYGDEDIGNVHSKYNLARIQNLRNRALYSTCVPCIGIMPKQVSLMDRVQFSYLDRSKDRLGNVLDGAYFVERIVQTIGPSVYMIKYGLIREGINTTDKNIGLLG
jgi:hypothetical protein